MKTREATKVAKISRVIAIFIVISIFAGITLAADNGSNNAVTGKGVGIGKEKPHVIGKPVKPVKLKIDLRKIHPSPGWQPGQPMIEAPGQQGNGNVQSAIIRTVKENPIGSASAVSSGSALSSPIVNVEGIINTGRIPPDTNGAVGPRDYIQTVNTQFAIFDKAGTMLAGPFNINTLWINAGLTDSCSTHNDGDPVVKYDGLADRWVITQFVAFTNFCIAVSNSSDPVTGGWNLYDFSSNGIINDYPKFGVWPDAYYAGTNNGAGGGNAWAFDRINMLAGNVARAPIEFDLGGPFMLPSDLDGAAPPAGAPNVFIRFAGGNHLELKEFHVDFTTPASSTFNALPNIPVNPYSNTFCGVTGFRVKCIDQPATPQLLDVLNGEMMYRLQYRNFGSFETLVTNHDINVNTSGGNQAANRWYELHKVGGTWSLFQQGTNNPDTTNRWMGSIAMDRFSNLALGYSVSSKANNVSPGLRYTGRVPSDLAGTLEAESTLIAGGGSQLPTNCTSGPCGNRWGDYSSMSVDPVDQCTFWYTSEYYPSSSSGNWHTRIGSFRYCGSISGQKFNDLNGNGVKDAGEPGLPNWNISLLDINGSVVASTLTDSGGNYSFTGLQQGNYTIKETLQPGWIQIAPLGGTYNITLNGTDVTGIDFGNSENHSAVILFVPNATESEKQGAIASVNGTITQNYTIINAVAALIPVGTGAPSPLDILRQNPLVVGVDADVVVSITDSNADAVVRADQVWPLGFTGTGVRLAILDTGIATTHPEFAGRITACHTEVPGTTTCEDDKGHGTHVAGIAGAQGINPAAKGVAPSVLLMSDKVLNNIGSGTWPQVMAGIDWATTNNANIISMSLGGFPGSVGPNGPNCDAKFPVMKAAIDAANAKGITVVAAAGNSGASGVATPGCLSNTIAVGAVDNSRHLASFSSVGLPIQDHGIVAPGVNIYSTLPGGSYGTMSGTSMATPMVSGTVALMLSANPGLTPLQVRRLLQDTADKVQDSVASYDPNTGSSITHGRGQLDAFEAVRVVAPVANGGKGGVDIFLRDNKLDWGNTIQPSDTLLEPTIGFIPHWVSKDIKVDAPPYQPAPTAATFDSFVDETPSAIAGDINRVYVRVHNRGPVTASSVIVKLQFHQFSAGLFALPSDFWTAWPSDSSDTTSWHPLKCGGTTSSICTVTNLGNSGSSVATTPSDGSQVVEFDFPASTLILTALAHVCLNAIIDSPQDPIPPSSKASFDLDYLTPHDSHITHRNYYNLRTSGSNSQGSISVIQQQANGAVMGGFDINYVFANAQNPPPPPPVPQNLGIYDTSIDLLKTKNFSQAFWVNNPFNTSIQAILRLQAPQDWAVTLDNFNFNVPFNLTPYQKTLATMNWTTNTTDQSACRTCHQTSGTNISGGYNNTIGGVPTRHHNMLPEGVINPFTNAPFGCQDCHPSTPGVGNGILLDRRCQDCHNGTSFWGNSIGGRVGNFSRPHHVNTGYDDANIGQPAQNRTCNFCHGSFADNYNDGHYVPSYNTSFMITPFATFKATNFSLPNPIPVFNSSGFQVLDKTWGGCESCHLADPNAIPYPIGSNRDNHHKEILGFAKFGGQNQFQNASTPFVGVSNICSVCHVIDITNSTGNGNTFPLEFNTINTFTGELLTNAMEVRNSTIEQGDVAIGAFEPGTTNITINGTGCEKCHSVKSIHNIQFNYVQNGPQGLGHINNNSDCSGCHDSWPPANTFVPGALIPSVDSVNPSILIAGTATTLTITGTNFVNDPYTSVVTVDGVTYYPTSVTDTEIVVDIPGLTTGTHQLQIVKGRDTLSKLYALEVVPAAHITSATISKGVITINGVGFGARPATNAQYYVSVNHAGNQIVSTSINGWSNTQIKAKNSAATAGDTVTVITANSGETTATIT